MMLGKLDSNIPKNETGSLSPYMNINPKINSSPKCEIRNYKNLRTQAVASLTLAITIFFFYKCLLRQGKKKTKKKLLGLHQNKKLLCSFCEGNNQQNQKATYGI